jgi:hypothetical protein
MKRRVTAFVVALAAGAAAAEGDREWIDVRDLVGGESMSLRIELAVSSHPAGADLDGAHGIAGENALQARIGERDTHRGTSPDALTSLLAALPPTENVDVAYDAATRTLGCAPEGAAAVKRALADLRARLPGPIAVRLALSRDGEAVLRTEGHVAAAASSTFADAVDHRVVLAYEVELAQASSIADPILATLRTGASVSLCVTPLPGSRSAVVETVARTVTPSEPGAIDLGHPGFGRADRCETWFAELATTFRIESGRPSSVTWTGRDGARMSLEITATWTVPPPEGDPAVVVADLVGSQFAGFRNSLEKRVTDDAESRDRFPPLNAREFSAEGLIAAAFRDSDYVGKVRAAETILVLPESGNSTAAEQAESFCAAADRLMEAAQVDCIAVIVPEGAQVTVGGPLPAGAQVVASYSGSAVLGLPFCTTGGTERRYLADWDVEVAQSSRIPDPDLRSLPTGHFLDLEVRRDAVAVNLDLRRLERLERTSMQLAVGRESAGLQSDEVQKTSYIDSGLPAERVAIEKPVVASLAVAAVVPLGADGTGVLRRSAPSMLGRGQELVVVVRVR